MKRVLAVLACTLLAASTIAESGDLIEQFDYEGVELHDGRQKQQFEKVKDFYMALRPNDMLRGFRLRAEKYGSKGWAPGKELGGAYSGSALTFGQWLGGFARAYKATGDPAIRERCIYLMNEWGSTIDTDGKFGYSDRNPGTYNYEKFVGGLVDVYQFTGDANALKYLDQITTWAEKNYEPRRGGEWYTLAENLFRAYELTGEKRYYEFAKQWTYDDFWGAFENKEDPFTKLEKKKSDRKGFHAYSHVNSLSSAAMAYKASGEQKYLDTIINAYDWLKATQLYATGGYGPEENLVVPNGMPESLIGIRRGESNVDVRFHFETSCGSWAGFKLASYLMRFTGEAKYGDWIERLFYNGVGAMPLLPVNDYGMIMYGSSYNTYGARKHHSTVWFCCQGSLLQTVSDYHNLVYFKDKKNLYVNLFAPSSVDWSGPDGDVALTQITTFPESDTVNLKVKCDGSSTFGLKFRVPTWAKKGVGVQLNGKDVDVNTEPGTWALIDRKWKNDDVITLRFDMSVHAEPAPGVLSPVAVMRGPVVMVKATALDGGIPTEEGLNLPCDWLEINAGAQIDRERQLHTNAQLKPFYSTGVGEYYSMYFNRSHDKVISTDEMTFKGTWQQKGNRLYSDEKDAAFEKEFEGTAVVWNGLRHKHAGTATVYIDGKKVAEVDQYGYADVYVPRYDQREVPFRWSMSGLEKGKHTIKVVVAGSKGELSSGTAINVNGITTYM